MKRLALLLLVTFFVYNANAQFTVGHHYIGPSIGLSFLGSTPQFGANYEYSMAIENFGNIGIGGVFRYWSYGEDYFYGKWSYTDVLIGLQGNYHFKLENEMIDPWAGIVLAYDAGSVSWDGPGGYNYASPSYGGVFMGFHAGGRYWFSPNIAASVQFGYGSLSYGALELGVDFKL